jgi:hypothetical protein
MKTDLYTKAVLTVIAVMLSVIAVNQLAKPVPAHAASEPTGFAVNHDGTYFYTYTEDANGGVVRQYDYRGNPTNHFDSQGHSLGNTTHLQP